MDRLETAADWDARYGEKDGIWSGAPNAQLVADVAGLTPGTALDAGCGEGADSVWLAQQGWDVTGFDISGVAVERARAAARSASVDVTFEVRDVVASPPPPSTYDLVSAQFFHFPDPPRRQIFTSLGEAVAPGGRLLVVGHEVDLSTRQDHRGDLFEIDEITALFTPPGWAVEVAEKRDRHAMHHGAMHDMTDLVVLLRRLA